MPPGPGSAVGALYQQAVRSVTLLRRVRRAFLRLRGWPDLKGLERAGMRIGEGVSIGPGTSIDAEFCFLVSIGNDTVISLDVLILAHDASTRRHLGYTRVAPVSIGDQVFIGARSLILPGVTIGDGAIVGAGSVVRADVAPWTVVAGNPARELMTTGEYLERHRARLTRRPRWEREGWTVSSRITAENRALMLQALRDGEAFIK